MKPTLIGRVIATFGRHMVSARRRRELRARPFGRALGVVCGDEVRCRLDPHHDEVHVVEVLAAAQCAVARSNARGGAEPVVANLTQLLVVLAPLPAPDLFVVDRYLAAAAPLGGTRHARRQQGRARDRRRAGCRARRLRRGRLPRASAARPASGDGARELLAALGPGAVAALVGQSGVGKSSLVRRLVPQAAGRDR